MTWTDALISHPRRSCGVARTWLRSLPPGTTPEQAWAACTRGDWMLWLLGVCAGRAGDPGRVLLALAAADCAELALPHTRAARPLVERCLATLRAWSRGEASIDDVRRDRRAYTYSAAEAADAYAADAAVCAVDAGIGYAAVAYAAAAYAADAAYSAGADARARVLRECADIVRRHYPRPPVIPGVYEPPAPERGEGGGE